MVPMEPFRTVTIFGTPSVGVPSRALYLKWYFFGSRYLISTVLYCLVETGLILDLFVPSNFSRLSGARSRGQQAKQSTPDVPLSSNSFQLLLGDPKVFPGQMRYAIPPACSGSTPGPPTSGTCPVLIFLNVLESTSIF